MEPEILQSPNGKNQATLYYGQDVRETLKGLPDKSIQTICTSPPYFGLRDYSTAKWEGGDPNCQHEVQHWDGPKQTQGAQSGHAAARDRLSRAQCACGAVWIDQQIGLEETPEAYVESLVEVFREIRRTLRDDGTIWLNLGDSYANDGKWGGSTGGKHSTTLHGSTGIGRSRRHTGLKPKDLIGIPWMVAFALRTDGWYLRSDVCWQKKNSMPEPVTDRPTKSHEYIFLLTKSPSYFYDNEAVKERSHTGPAPSWDERKEAGAKCGSLASGAGTQRVVHGKGLSHDLGTGLTRNLRSVWTLPTHPYPEAHFATFPPTIPEICIKAGTSEKGRCPTCGAPWKRLIEKEIFSTRHDYGCDRDNIKQNQGHGKDGRSGRGNCHLVVTTAGWQPTCQCPPHTPIPCVVLDPFSGSATTGKVAWDLGRNYIGIDLNPEYLNLAKGRLLEMPSKAFKEVSAEGNLFKDLW